MFRDPQIFVKHAIAQFGGAAKAFEIFDADHRMLDDRWRQDTEIIGRILRSHLFVEHFLTEYLLVRNPQLGSLDDARLTFTQKLALVSNTTDAVRYLLPGIRHLNTIRNRLAHRLAADISPDDANLFLAIGMFRAMRDAMAKPNLPNTEPIAVLEDFARHAGIMLHAAASPTAKLWAEAIRLAEEEEREIKTRSAK